jgi:hypothetical protein
LTRDGGDIVTSIQDQNTLFQGKMKKEDDVDDGDHDDVVRTKCKDRVTVTLCTEELFLRTQYL